MHNGFRSRKMVYYGTMLMLSWSLMPMGLPVAYSQEPVPIEPAPTQPAPEQPPPTMTPTETEPANSQPVEPVPASQGIDRECRKALETLCVGIQPGGGRLRKCYDDKESTLTPDCRQQVQMHKAEAAAILGTALGTAAQAEPETIIEHKRVRPSETYVAGFGGYTFGGGFSDVEGTGRDRDLADSVVYGGKVGHFFGDRLDWLGLEMEAYNTTPHVEQDGQLPGLNQRVTTLAFNVVGRLKFGCETKRERTETRTERAGTRRDEGTYMERKDPTTGELYRERRDPSTGDIYRERRDPKTGELYLEGVDAKTGEVIRVERDVKMDREIRYETQYEREFCRLQPYGGVGLGVFFAHLSLDGNNFSDNAVPGFNALAGLRYFVTERIALFGEYKYNFAPFDYTANGPSGGAAGVKADYHINHFVGGLSLHF